MRARDYLPGKSTGTPELIHEMGDGVLLVSHGQDLKTDENEDLLRTRTVCK